MPLCKQGTPVSIMTLFLMTNSMSIFWCHKLSCLTHMPCAVARVPVRSGEPPQFTLTVSTEGGTLKNNSAPLSIFP